MTQEGFATGYMFGGPLLCFGLVAAPGGTLACPRERFPANLGWPLLLPVLQLVSLESGQAIPGTGANHVTKP